MCYYGTIGWKERGGHNTPIYNGKGYLTAGAVGYFFAMPALDGDVGAGTFLLPHSGSRRCNWMLWMEKAMIYKRCPRCGKRIECGIVCGCHKREYGAPTGINKQYHTKRWQALRAATISKSNGLDLWALHHGRIEYADTVHHIVSTVEDPSLFYSMGNLIPVSRPSHDEIHGLYKTKKKETQELLRLIVGKGAGGI